MSRAKLISCVAITIVIPPAASSRITSSTSATSSGSSALVTSSSSISSGLHRERAHDRDALLLAAGEPVRVVVALVGETEALEQLGRVAPPPRARERPSAVPRRERHVASTRHVRKEVERLEDDPDPPPHLVDVDAARGDLLAARRRSGPRRSARGDSRSAAASTCRSRMRRSGRRPRARPPPGRLRAAPRARPNDLWTPSTTSASLIRLPAAWRRRRSRATSQSVKRASGIVSATNSTAAATIRRVVERRGRVDLRLLERFDRAEEADERRVLLQSDEVVQERRNRRGARPGAGRRSERLPARSARASAQRPPGSDAPTRSRRDRPRTRTPCRRARARRFPRTSSRVGTPQLQRRRAEPEQRDHEDRRHAPEEVCVGDRQRAQREEHRPRAGCESRRARARRRG